MAERTPLPGDAAEDLDLVDEVRPEVVLGEVAPEEPADAPDPVRPGDAVPVVIPRSARALLWQARIGLGVGVLGALLAVAFALQAADLREQEATRAAVLEAAEVVALRVTTFEGSEIEAWVADLQSLATGGYADEVAGFFDAELREGIAEFDMDSVGTIESSFVQDLDGDRATAFLVVRQEFTTVVQPEPVSDELRMEVHLDLVDGAWLASEVAILGPSRVAPVPGAGGAPPTDLLPSEGAPGS